MNNKEKWWKRSVVYQVYPRSFKDSNNDGIGDLPGIIEKLDYLKKLGIGIIWLSPVYKSPNDDNGYDISDYYQVMDDFGTMEDMERLIKEAKKRNIRIMMDLVINHTSDEHPWFLESKKSKNNPYRDFYIWRDGKEGNPPSDIGSVFSGSAWKYDPTTDQYFFHLFSKRQPDLNFHNEEVRKKIYEMMNFWLKKGIGGFRMDVIDLLGKVVDEKILTNGPKLHEYLQEMNREVLSRYDIVTVGETPSVNTEIAKLYTGNNRNELDMVFTFEHMSLDEVRGYGKWALKPLSLVELKAVFNKWQTELQDEGWNSLYWNNHDQPRIVSRFGNDSVYRVESAKMLATVLHLMKGTPYIYEGEEIGMTNAYFKNISDYRDVETLNYYNEKKSQGVPEEEIMKSLMAKGRDNARTPMQWDDTENAGFSGGTPWLKVNPNYTQINARRALEDKNSVFHHYRKLISIRKKLNVITTGKFELIYPDDDEIFAYTRTNGKETLMVVANFREQETVFTVPEEYLNLNIKVLIKNYPKAKFSPKIRLRPYEVIVYQMVSGK
jgi:oligo-1,6-glucosidase/glucan 1,6-alpha-glucosidase